MNALSPKMSRWILAAAAAAACGSALAASRLPALADALGADAVASAADYVGRAGFRVRDAAELERMKRYLAEHYRGVVVRHAFELEPGTVVDCIDELTQPGAQRHGLTRESWLRAPSQAPQQPVDAAAAERRQARDPGVFLAADAARAARDDGGRAKSCAPGTIPKIRLGLAQLAAFESLEHFRHKRGLPGAGGLPGRSADGRVSPQLASVHEYAHAYDWVTNWGAESTLNVWKAYTEKSSEFSLSQIWVTEGGGQETVEAGWQVYRNRHILNPKDPYFFIYSTQDGYNQTGCYDLTCNDFVQTNNAVVIGGRWTNQSVVGGAQYSTPILIQKDGTTGHWWIAVDGVYAGYYPRTLYDTNGIRDQAALVDFGGEIVNTWPSGRHTKTDMGSGYKPSAGFGYAAYQRTIRYVNTSNQYATPSLIETRTDSGCYDIDTFYASGAWKTHFYFGGEGYGAACP